MTELLIIAIPSGPIKTNAYLIAGEKHAWAVDPAPGSAPKLIEEARNRGLEIVLIINTHGHWDHVEDNEILREETGAPLAIHEADAREVREADRFLADGDALELEEFRFRVIHTPGHTPGGICLLEEKEKVMLSGDTLFAGTYGRTDLEGGNPKIMALSLSRLAKLDQGISFYPGHGPRSTIGAEDWLQRIVELGRLP